MQLNISDMVNPVESLIYFVWLKISHYVLAITRTGDL